MNGRIEGREQQLACYETLNKIVSTQSEMEKENINARVNGVFRVVFREQLEYCCVDEDMFSFIMDKLPYRGMNEPERSMMGGNMLKQAIVLKYPDSSLIKNSTVCLRKHILHKPFLFGSWVMFEDENSGGFKFRCLRVGATNQHTITVPMMHSGMYCDSRTGTDEYYIGKNLYCGFQMCDGVVFEDGIGVRESVVRSGALSSMHIHTFTIPIRVVNKIPELITTNVISPMSYNLSHIGEDGVVKLNTYVRGGDPLVLRMTPRGEQGVHMSGLESILQDVI